MEPFQFIESSKQLCYFSLPSWTALGSALHIGFSSRIGGVSEGDYDSLNCALHVGDKQQDVIDNRFRLSREAGFHFSAWTCAEQVHGNRIEKVTTRHRGRGRYLREDAIDQADGLVTNVPGIVLTSFYADCVPLFFYDPVKKVVALAHAGWKGTVLEIASNMVEVMRQQYNCNISNVRAAIGPSIGGCCYEVDERVMTPIHEVWKRMDGLDANLPLTSNGKEGKWLLDLKAINHQILLNAGIQPAHIEVSELCTSCRTDWFFSHRKENGKTGRMVSWIGLRGESDIGA